MSSLKDRIVQLIERDGPMSVSAYMTLCLHDADTGYYATRPGIGEDFITAPEISQVFGELIGVWLAHEWRSLGKPERFYLVEVGAGRGTLMQDALRAAQSVPGFIQAAQLKLIEASPALRALQAQTLADYAPHALADLTAVPSDAPILLIANEWLDCLPANQFVRTGTAWHERVIGTDPDGNLAFGLSATPLTGEFDHLSDRLALEVQPGLATIADTLSTLFENTVGRALLIDYGTEREPPQDSLRAYKAGAQIDPLAEPGASDLTVDVDFARLAELCRAASLRVDGPVPQGAFLQALGAEARLNSLAKQVPEKAEALYQGVVTLVDPQQMGTRFKALCLSSKTLSQPAGF